MSTEETRRALNKAIADHIEAADLLNEDEIIVNSVTIVGTRRVDGGGAVIFVGSDEGMPEWEVRGIVHTLITTLDKGIDDD